MALSGRKARYEAANFALKEGLRIREPFQDARETRRAPPVQLNLDSGSAIEVAEIKEEKYKRKPIDIREQNCHRKACTKSI